MDQPGSIIFGPMAAFGVLLCMFCGSMLVFAQSLPTRVADSSARQHLITKPSKDSVRVLINGVSSSLRKALTYKKNQVSARFTQMGDTPSVFKQVKRRLKIDTTLKNSLKNPFKDLVLKKPLTRLTDGYSSYQFNYRSNIDTPYMENNIGQHNLMARVNVLIGGVAPVAVSYWGRRSNSRLFRDLNDVQVSFHAAEFAGNLQSRLRERLSGLVAGLKDSLAGRMLDAKRSKLLDLEKWLNSSAQLQKLVEANEIIQIPRVTYEPDLPDSINAAREDALKKMAVIFLDLYKSSAEKYIQLNKEVDSLEKAYNQSLGRIKRIQQIVSGGWRDFASYNKWKEQLTALGVGHLDVPPKYRWLMGIRTLNLGRSVLNQSELTAKNISVNGINFEYNSWYYLGVTAGIIDYRFRDFIVSPLKKTPQYLYILRLGLGTMQGNHIIVSGFRGQKQLFTGSTNRGGLSSINVMGYSVKGRINLNKTSYLTAEVAESVSPDFRNNPAIESTKFGLSDKTNNAYAVYLFSYIPSTGSRIEGMYKYTGANFQSFSSFQTNAGQQAWYVKADQHFFKKQLRISAALRSTDFFNPFIVQQYKSNTIFKSVTATFRKRKWPVVTVGYIPMSQITRLGNQLIESRFQTLNASSYYLYKIHKTNGATSVVYNQFYNDHLDSSCLYYNAVNVYASQHFYFRLFTTGVVAAYTKNNNYQLLVLEEMVAWNFPKWGTVGFGVKVHNFNKDILRLGGYANATMRIGKGDMLSLSVEKGYLPGYNGGLIQNEMASIQFAKAFRFN